MCPSMVSSPINSHAVPSSSPGRSASQWHTNIVCAIWQGHGPITHGWCTPREVWGGEGQQCPSLPCHTTKDTPRCSAAGTKIAIFSNYSQLRHLGPWGCLQLPPSPMGIRCLLRLPRGHNPAQELWNYLPKEPSVLSDWDLAQRKNKLFAK